MPPSPQPPAINETSTSRPADSGGILAPWLRMFRVHQWSKNALLFVPLITSHRPGERPLLLACLLAFLAFSLGASSLYFINDLVDLPADRLHPWKRLRPLTSGRIAIPAASAVLIVVSIGLGAWLP